MKCIFDLVRLSIPFAFSFSRRYRAALSNNALRQGVRGPQAVILLRGCLQVLCQSSRSKIPIFLFSPAKFLLDSQITLGAKVCVVSPTVLVDI